MNIYGYGCFPASTKDPYRSTVYKSLRNQFLPKENVILDVIGDRKNLSLLLDRCSAGDSIVILNRRTLGITTEFRKLWKEIVIERKINLLIVDEDAKDRVDYYSSCDYGFTRFEESIIDEKWQKLQKDVFERQTKVRGRKTIGITFRFKEIYWYYQNFFIRVEEACTILGISKPTFYAISKEYETTQEYKDELYDRKELHNLPKRGGITREIEMLLMNVERLGMDLPSACKTVGISEMTQIEYERYRMAKLGGRKEQFRLENERHDDDLVLNLLRKNNGL